MAPNKNGRQQKCGSLLCPGPRAGSQGRAYFQPCSVLSRVFLEHTSLILAFGVTPALR